MQYETEVEDVSKNVRELATNLRVKAGELRREALRLERSADAMDGLSKVVDAVAAGEELPATVSLSPLPVPKDATLAKLNSRVKVSKDELENAIYAVWNAEGMSEVVWLTSARVTDMVEKATGGDGLSERVRQVLKSDLFERRGALRTLMVRPSRSCMSLANGVGIESEATITCPSHLPGCACGCL